MLRYLPTLLVVGLLVYCLIDCVQSQSASVRSLPKGIWIVLILVLPLFGSLGWLLAGRPANRPRRGGGPPPRPEGPDDDPDFLRGLGPPH